jgi:ketosteroid isomerase-like protein
MSHRAVWIAVIVVFLGVAGAPQPAQADEGELEALRRRERDFLAALGARDLAATTAHFAEEAVLQVASMPPLEGREAIARFYGNVFRFMQASTAAPERLKVSSGADLAYSAGRVSNVFEGESGPVEYEGKYLLVWEKREGEWRIVLYAVSNNQAEARRS